MTALPLLAESLPEVVSRDKKVIRRWTLAGDPRGVAFGTGNTIYVGLAEPQAIVAIDGQTGAVKQRLVLDSAEIASTKELVTLRTNAAKTRLYIANGSDESATILSLPDLAVLREITMEGEAIRDVLPDPRGRYVYLLGRSVHVFDKDGDTELRTLDVDDPMAIAATADGRYLAVVAAEDFGNATATSVTLFETTAFTEVTRDPLQTDKTIEGALFGPGDHALIAWGRDYLYEMPLKRRTTAPMQAGQAGQANAPLRITIDFGDLVNSDRACLPEGSGPQVATLAGGNLLVYAERRCSASGAFSGSNRTVAPASLYGVDAYAIAYDPASSTIAATDRKGFLTVYRVPRASVAK